MAESSSQYHEPYELLSPKTRDHHRAIISLIEELEAIDWYQQRADAVEDEELRAILLHNKEEEAEHAMMSMEWLRRRDADLANHAQTYLFTQGSILEVEEADTTGSSGESTSAKKSGKTDTNSGSLGIGSLKEGQA